MLKQIFYDTFIRSELELQENPPAKGFDFKVLIILVWTAFGLSIVRYFGDSNFTANVIGEWGFNEASDSLRSWAKSSDLHRLGWWIGTMFFVYIFIPVLLIRFVFRESPLDYGWRMKGAFKDWWLYALMLVIMIPLVIYFSSTSSFKARYPFYNPEQDDSLWPNLWIWELMYFFQFIGVEFFFRGFMTLGMKKRFGFYSIFIMTVPYTMIHYGKPMPETIGAILAGLVLGTLSMKSRSIWMGILIHYSVAITMDLSALWRKGLLF